jgi:hypothetical protein
MNPPTLRLSLALFALAGCGWTYGTPLPDAGSGGSSGSSDSGAGGAGGVPECPEAHFCAPFASSEWTGPVVIATHPNAAPRGRSSRLNKNDRVARQRSWFCGSLRSEVAIMAMKAPEFDGVEATSPSGEEQSAELELEGDPVWQAAMNAPLANDMTEREKGALRDFQAWKQARQGA